MRALVHFIDKRQRKPIYTDFEDLMGSETSFDLPGFAVGTDQAKFVAKARAFLRQHLDHIVIHKLRMNKPLTPGDLDELERMLMESGVAATEDIERAKAESLHRVAHEVPRRLIGWKPVAPTRMTRFATTAGTSANGGAPRGPLTSTSTEPTREEQRR